MNKLLAASLLASTLSSGVAFADDWNVTRLRGVVLHQVDGEWLPLRRNDVVPDDRRIRTSNNGYATLVRGSETLELGPSTQIRIIDEGGNKPYTTVLQSWGTVAVEAEVRDVAHFAVANQYLAAVVKGTRFVVKARSTGGSVDVERGLVGVGSSGGSTTVVSAAQAASVRPDGTINVSGDGVLPEVVAGSDISAVNAAMADLSAAKAAGDVAAIEAATKALQKAKRSGDDKTAAKAAADAAKAAEKAAREQARADEMAAREQAKADDAARRAAERAARDAEKNNNGGNSGKGNDNPDKGGKDSKGGKGKD